MPPLDPAIALLRRVPLFRDLAEDDLQALMAICTRQACQAGDVLIREGKPADALFIVDDGHVEIRKSDRPGALARLGPGECVGDMSIVSDEPPSVSVVCATACALLVITRAEFQALMTRNPAVSAGLIRLLVQRLQRANNNIREVNGITRDIETLNRVVGRVSQQTHILAINAGIEAARAGQAGRGFTVVANEMRQLADEAQTVFQRIEQLIKQIKSQD